MPRVMRASLPMYDLPEVRAATDDWWRGMASALRRAGLDGVPDGLDREAGEGVWRSRDLLLSQTCGYPMTHALAGLVAPVCTPAYGADGCSGAEYCSLVVVAAGSRAAALADLRGARCAYSRRDSHSGYNALRAAIAPLATDGSFFAEVTQTGAHANSLARVARGHADVCAVDCVTHALIRRHRPAALGGTRVLCMTERAPGLPYVTRASVDADVLVRLRDGLRAAFSDPHLAATREALLLVGAEELERGAYRRIDEMEIAARDAGYPEIH